MAISTADPRNSPSGIVLADCYVVLLVGGSSGEREISLKSGAALEEGLVSLKEQGTIRGFLRIEWLPDGRWDDGATVAPPAALLGNLPPNPLFLLGLHGGGGEDGSLQGLLSSLGIPFTGSGVAASALCMDKHLSRLLFQDAGYGVAPGALMVTGGIRAQQAQACQADGEGPWFVKPRRGGSSLATHCVTDWKDLVPALDDVWASGDEPLVEVAIQGVEVTVGLLDLGGELPEALPLVEICPHEGHFFDFQEKYTSDGAQEVCPPKNLGPERCQEVASIAQRAFRMAGCAGYARMDFIVPQDGPPVCLEINTLPGFTQRSLLPMAAGAVGICFSELVHKILDHALLASRPRI